MARPPCPRCARMRKLQAPIARRALSSTAPTLSKQSPSAILAKPTWSIASLLATSPSPSTPDEISPQKLNHLLRLSALPAPATPQATSALLAALHAHLRFVRDVQAVDTTGVEPLRALRDETARGRVAATVGLAELRSALDKEVAFGHRQRPRRVKGDKAAVDQDAKTAEAWNPLGTAQRTAGKYFVVQSKKGQEAA
ncbi:hypothetical protein BN1723_015223 [Verticillium longisporum]|uniref:Glutamyl-tRNA amidotransferase complex subunit Gta3 domain-containing protein n=1 Tax=Verticillium longisporum TaxID=100787 RepID=A0A0G4MTQ3_VERLO|nr:hypothetical protein HYQ44_006705 [Verticillium longisporum]CRK33325.1 hypothetical protein BN1708_001013 [Verticillium longisporum]CRK37676.1 hypothetical protein BN1723_015223 [Verticillium longisporum]